MAQILFQPHGGIRLGDFLNSHFGDGRWTEFKAAIAFVKYSGVRHIEQALRQFAARARVVVAAGVDCQGSSLEGLSALLAAVGQQGEIWIFHNENESTFHPKIYVFRSPTAADVVVGSGNLTSGGLFTNYEASAALSLDLAQPEDARLLDSIEQTLASWSNGSRGTARRLDAELLEALTRHRYLALESQQPGEPDPDAPVRRLPRPPAEALFARVAVQRAPSVRGVGGRARRTTAPLDVVPAAARAAVRGFAMTLKRGDVGYGQTTPGRSRRSPEIFVPLAARSYAPEFWGWPHQFVEGLSKRGKRVDRREVRVRIGAQVIDVNMMTWPDKHDLRLRSEVLRSAARVGDILRLETLERRADYVYDVEIIRRGSTEHDYYLGLCTEPVRNSDKRWGYYL